MPESDPSYEHTKAAYEKLNLGAEKPIYQPGAFLMAMTYALLGAVEELRAIRRLLEQANEPDTAEAKRPAGRTDQVAATGLTAAEVDSLEECPTCTCCTPAGCHRGLGSECVTPEGEYICPCTKS